MAEPVRGTRTPSGVLMAPAPPRSHLVAGFAAVYILWGSTYLAIRFAVESFPPFVMAGTRHLTAGLLLFAFLRTRGAALPEKRHWKSAAIIGGLLLLGGNGFVSWAEQRVPSGLAALIVASVPIWMAVVQGILRRRRPPAAVLAGLLIGLGGLVLLVLPGRFGGGEHVDPLGAAALMFAALSWVIGSLYSRRAALPSSTLLAISIEMIAGGALLWIAGLAFGEGARLHASSVSLRSVLSLGYLIVFGSLIGFSAYIWLLKVTTPARVTTYAYVNPVVAVLLGWAFAGEALTLRIGLAAAAIVGAVALIIRYGGEAEEKRPAASPPIEESPLARENAS
ncbi:MAG: drug/metabolite exporter YedA [Acidobacteria bacterium]|nr:drug/metabolite exporter YedA [Acidobacteriota bacterium]MCA1610350.1 drug/metabolite exporter YedA [Acidobacteriota bacterium]